MSTPYLPVHGFIIDGELTNSPELFVAAVENKQPVMAVDTALLGLLFPNEIPEELNTFLEPMFELSFESGLLICLDKTVSFGAIDCWIDFNEITVLRYKCAPRIRLKAVSRLVLDVSQIMLGVTSLAEKIGVDFFNSGKDYVYATAGSDSHLLSLLALSSTIPFYTDAHDDNGFQVHVSLFGDRDASCSANEYILLSTRDIPCEAIYSTDYEVNDLEGFIIDYTQLMPVVYVKRGVHHASAQT